MDSTNRPLPRALVPFVLAAVVQTRTQMLMATVAYLINVTVLGDACLSTKFQTQYAPQASLLQESAGRQSASAMVAPIFVM